MTNLPKGDALCTLLYTLEGIINFICQYHDLFCSVLSEYKFCPNLIIIAILVPFHILDPSNKEDEFVHYFYLPTGEYSGNERVF